MYQRARYDLNPTFDNVSKLIISGHSFDSTVYHGYKNKFLKNVG